MPTPKRKFFFVHWSNTESAVFVINFAIVVWFWGLTVGILFWLALHHLGTRRFAIDKINELESKLAVTDSRLISAEFQLAAMSREIARATYYAEYFNRESARSKR